MSSTPTTKLIERLTENRLLSSAIALTTLLSGIATVSVPLLLLSGVFAYGWPFLHVYLASVNSASEKVAKPANKGLTSLHTSALAAR